MFSWDHLTHFACFVLSVFVLLLSAFKHCPSLHLWKVALAQTQWKHSHIICHRFFLPSCTQSVKVQPHNMSTVFPSILYSILLPLTKKLTKGVDLWQSLLLTSNWVAGGINLDPEHWAASHWCPSGAGFLHVSSAVTALFLGDIRIGLT